MCDIVTQGVACLPDKAISNDYAVYAYPNPTVANFSLVLKESSPANRLIRATIFDLMGNKILETEHLTEIDLTNSPSGLYIWEATDTNGNRYKGKISKQ